MKKIAPFYIMLAAFLWSLDGILRRELYTIPPATLVMLEHLVGLVLFIPLFPKAWRNIKQLNRKELGIMFAVSILGGAMGTIFYTAALAEIHYIKYTVVVLLQQTQPLFAIILACIILKESLNKRYILLAILGLISAYFLSFPSYKPNITGKPGEFWAALLALGAAVCWGASTVLGKLLLQKMDYFSLAVARFCIVVPCAYILSLCLGQSFSIAEVTSSQWLYLIGIAFSAGAVAMLLYYKGLKNTPAKVSTLVELTYPVSALFIGYYFLQERMTIVQTISGLALLIVIFSLASFQDPEKTEKKTHD